MKKTFLRLNSILIIFVFILTLIGCLPKDHSTESVSDGISTDIVTALQTQAVDTESVQADTHVTQAETESPVTQAPQTQAPVTASPETEERETEPIETESPQTLPFETEKQETEDNETEAPETEAPNEPDASTFNIHFIDVGQADSALIECDGHYMLIDGGNKADSNLVYSVLKTANVPKLDIVVATHPHEDHIGGIPGAFNYTTADITLCSVTDYGTKAFSDFKKYADSKGGGITIPRVGDTYSLGSAEIKILGVNGANDPNNTSIVLMITYGKTKFLFTGDAEREAEQVILNSGVDLSATVLKVGHHGSSSSTTYPFLREIMPEYAVICVGKGNSYGHPTDNTLSRLRDADVKVFRTDVNGDVYCHSDGNVVTFSVERNANIDPFENL